MFHYLGDMLSVNRDSDTTVDTRLRTGWNKFGQLVPLLNNKDISLIVIWSMKLRVPVQELDQRELGQRLWKKTVRHVN